MTAMLGAARTYPRITVGCTPQRGQSLAMLEGARGGGRRDALRRRPTRQRVTVSRHCWGKLDGPSPQSSLPAYCHSWVRSKESLGVTKEGLANVGTDGIGGSTVEAGD